VHRRDDHNERKYATTLPESAAHRVNIQRSLQHRLEVAKAKGDENLIRQLQAEMSYYN